MNYIKNFILLNRPAKSGARFFVRLLSLSLLLLGSAGPLWAQTSLTGLWVDSRTGRDFWEIEGNEQGFRFTAYGGNPSSPRYLSRGVALSLQAGHLNATVSDLPGRCCAQQGRLSIQVRSPNQLQVEGSFWNLNQPEEEGQQESFTLTRLGTENVSSPSPPPIIDYNPSPLPESGHTSPTWEGSWQGDGWARFFIAREGDTLKMFWYYSPQAPFFGFYQLDSSGLKAEGTALAETKSPGNTFYRHELRLDPDKLNIEIISRRLAAPLEDGRWVTWKNNPGNSISLHKLDDDLPLPERTALEQWFRRNRPQDIFESTLRQADREGALLKREHE
ncbi:MAG: hypothetical protein LBJ14_01360 [Desulfarculales bacterium]|jgi:hypothetical protein|nr:hypothetical protein [Desulfarculales bacterium]